MTQDLNPNSSRPSPAAIATMWSTTSRKGAIVSVGTGSTANLSSMNWRRSRAASAAPWPVRSLEKRLEGTA